jgi:Ca2+-binding EF-hand superfamily protein
VSVLLREFKVDNSRVNYRDLIKALEDYPAEATRASMVFPGNRKYIHDKKRRASSHDGGSKVDDFKDPSQRNRAALEVMHAKISRKIVNPGDLRLAFEKYDVSRRGRITYDFFIMALGQFGLVFEETETKTLLRSMDPSGEKSIEYGRFISMVFPPRNTQTARKGPVGFKASARTMSSMTAADQLRHLQLCIEKALAKGPRELQRMLGIFRLPGDEDVDLSSLKIMLMDFGLSLTDAQTLELMRHIDPTAKSRISYFRLISRMLPADCVLEQGMRSGLAVGSTMLHRHRPSQNKLSDADFHHAILARIKRQLYRKGPSGVPVGHQLREILSGLLCQKDVGMQDLRRAFVGVGILMDDSDIERLVNLYRSPSHPSMRLAKLIEDIDDRTFDYVFSTGNVAGAGLQRIQKELPAPKEPDALLRNKLRRVLRRRMEQDGSKSIVTVLRLHDLERTGRSLLVCVCISTHFCLLRD